MSKLLIVLVMFGAAGCSSNAIYDKLRLDERNKCIKEPPPTYFECVKREEISEMQKRGDVDGFQKIMEIHEK